MGLLAEPRRKSFKAMIINDAGVVLFGWAYKLRYSKKGEWRFLSEHGAVYFAPETELFKVVDHE